MSRTISTPKFLSKKFSRSSISNKLNLKSTKLSASVSEGSLGVESVEGRKIHPGIMTSFIFAPMLAMWALTTKNLTREVTLFVALFMNLFSLKFADGIVDDGLRFFKGAKYILPVYNIGSAIALSFIEDFIGTWFTGLTLGCLLAGKLDCIEFKASAAAVFGMFAFRKIYGTMTYGVVDVVAFALFAGIDEWLHGVYKKLKKADKKMNFVVSFLLESRLWSVIFLTPYFVARGFTIAAPLMVAQGAGYEIGGYLVEKIMKKKAEEEA